ncbi:MAG: hypothetical protein LBH22_08980 [Bacteroidales bacterium]|jgi:5-hydroxyisourate hydrolase-like protein (transthyretin family)|nr:hypothetical protein [Bacteroidales bacterium]
MKKIITTAITIFLSAGLAFSQPSKDLVNLIESAKLIAERDEDPLVRTIALFQSEINKFNTVEQAIVNSMIAECLMAYLQQNRWEIFERTPLANPDLTDVRTWDTRLLLQQTIAYYQASLQPREALQNLRVRDYKAILELGDDESEIQRPTMFDLLAHRAINAWSQDDLRLTQPLDGFLVDNQQYFSQSSVFATLKIPSIDTLSLDYQILKTYQLLSQFHLRDYNRDVLVPLTLQRMAWVRKKAVFENVDSLYQKALETYVLLFPNPEDTFAAQIYWALAEFHNELGNRHNNLVSEDFRLDKKAALRYTEILQNRFTQTPFANAAKSLAEQIQLPAISLTMQELILPNQHNLFLMRYANAEKVYFWLYRLSEEDLRSADFLQDRQLFIMNLTSGRASHNQWITTVPNPGDFQIHRIELSLQPLPVGYYVLFASTNGVISTNGIDLEAQFFGVSELSLVSNSTDEKLEGIVLNRRTGKPFAGVNIRLFSRTFDWRTRQETITELAKLTTPKNGRFEYSLPQDIQSQSIQVELQHKSDMLLSLNESHWLRNAARTPERARRQLFLFTDRAIYRPGQTVYFKGILVERQGDESKIVTNMSTTVRLFDANHKEVSAVEVTTNEFGSFSGHFVLPSRGLNGQFLLRNDFGSSWFLVEEYKRPSFEVVFNPLQSAYQLEQELTVTGVANTYSGAGLGGSTVKYTVMRSAQFPTWRRTMFFRPQGGETVITHGEATTDESGQFEISFIAHSDRRIPANQNPTYTFTVTVDVTDVSGETRSNVQRIFVSQKALRVSLNTKPFIDKTKDSVLQISSTNLSGENMPSKGVIKVFRLLPDRRLLRDRLWEVPNMFELSKTEFIKRFPNDLYSNENLPENRDKEFGFEKEYNTELNTKIVLDGLPLWESGEYYYVIETKDVFGNAVTGVNFFTIFSPKSDRSPLEKFYYTIFPNNTFEPGQTAFWIIGSASKIDVFYEISSKNGVLEQRVISLNNEQRRIEFPIKEDHRGNLSLQIWSVKDNRTYTTNEVIFVPFSNRKIDISFETFREKLTPNTQENWTLRLLSNDKKPLQGELLLSMYDASLDVFQRNNWRMNFDPFFHGSSRWLPRNFGVRSSQQLKFPDFFMASPPSIQYDRINFEPPFFGGRFSPFSKGLMRSAMMTEDNEITAEMVAEDAVVTTMQDSGFSETSETSPEPQTPGMLTPRTNLNETAFFYPFLRSDANGKISVSFTVPESLTRWRIQGLAHTRDLKIGIDEWSAITQKMLMVNPNVPRFLREGDQIHLQARIINLSDKPISGQANLAYTVFTQFRPIATEDTWLKDFSIASMQNTSVSWQYKVNHVGLLNLTFSAKAENHTDGEVQMIPVLSNRALLTETMPMFAAPKSNRTFTFAKLAKPNSKTLTNHRLVLEVASNPIWFAVQALPELSLPNSVNSIALFGAYFSNAMAIDILNRNPEIKDVFNRWKMTDSETLKSNLEINQDLKSVLLNETPWVLDAENEARQKQNIALFFDENNVRNLQGDALTRLRELQLPNGGFTWYPGGRGDLWNTQYIVHGLQKMHRRDIERNNFELQEMLQKALNFCDEQHIQRYQDAMKLVGSKNFKLSLSPNDIQYLYLRMYFANEYPISSDLAEVLANYDSLAKSTWRDRSRFLQGILALYFDLKGEQKLVQDIMQNFQRLALRSPEFGMWWRYESSWFWYESAIETQSQLIEVFEKLGKQEDVAQMKQWLLSQKRTTRWNTPKASVEAIYALLLNTPNLAENTNVEIQIGDEKITTPATADAGSGYFTRFWTADQINAKQAQVTIRNQGNSMVWGGVYWQYFEDLDKVTAAATPLSVKKTLFVERMTNRGAVLESIPKEGLKIGDRVVVRVEVRTDRDLDFVHLKDLRAAAFEPVDMRSGYRSQSGLFYYQDAKDVSMNYFFSHLPRGTYVFEYRVNVSQIGDFSNGYTSIQCLYAPEFSAQSQGERVVVK